MNPERHSLGQKRKKRNHSVFNPVDLCLLPFERGSRIALAAGPGEDENDWSGVGVAFSMCSSEVYRWKCPALCR